MEAGPSGPWFLLCFWDLKHRNGTVQMKWTTFSRRTFFQSLHDSLEPITSASWIIMRDSTVPTSGEDPNCDSAVTSGRRLSASHPSRRHQQSLGLIKQDCVNTLSMKTRGGGGDWWRCGTHLMHSLLVYFTLVYLQSWLIWSFIP